MIRILHAADLHLDSPFAALAPEQAAARRREQRETLIRLMQACTEQSCEILLLAGDLFDSARIYADTVDLLRQLFADCPAQIFIAPGNHDPYGPDSVYCTGKWPDNVHIFSGEQIAAVSLPELGVTVYGAAFTGSSAASLLHDFHAVRDGSRTVMVLHGELGNPHSTYNPISEDVVLGSGLDYLALGHIHQREIRRIGDTTVGNPGCFMGRGFDETGEKGALLVRLNNDSCETEFLPLGAREYHTLSVTVSEDPMSDLIAALPEGTERDIYRIILSGTCRSFRRESLYQALRSRFYGLELVDRTIPPSELWDGMDADHLRGAFLRNMKAQFDDAAEADREIVLQAVRIGLALLDGREVPEL